MKIKVHYNTIGGSVLFTDIDKILWLFEGKEDPRYEPDLPS